MGSTQPLTEMSTRGMSWGKGGRCLRLTNLPPSCTVAMKSGNLDFMEPSGPLQACNGTAASRAPLAPLAPLTPYKEPLILGTPVLKIVSSVRFLTPIRVTIITN